VPTPHADDAVNSAARDILSIPWLGALVYGLPVAAIVATGSLDIGSRARALLWAASLGTMAAGCTANALRCRRVHCYFTAPFLLLMALASLAYGFGWLTLGADGWNRIALVTLIGAVVLTFVPERLLGRYR
jgi:hypothetical protein